VRLRIIILTTWVAFLLPTGAPLDAGAAPAKVIPTAKSATATHAGTNTKTKASKATRPATRRRGVEVGFGLRHILGESSRPAKARAAKTADKNKTRSAAAPKTATSRRTTKNTTAGTQDPSWPPSLRNIDKVYPAGDVVGRGAYKNVFAVKGRPDLVVAVFREKDASHNEQFKAEIDGLRKLREIGVPTVEVVGVGRTRSGLKTMVMRRYVASSRDHNQFQRPLRDEFLSRINENTTRDYQLIKQKLKKADLSVHDAQVLIDKTGHLILHDPLRVESGFDGFQVRGLPDNVTRARAP
jgi:hypothetical protein